MSAKNHTLRSQAGSLIFGFLSFCAIFIGGCESSDNPAPTTTLSTITTGDWNLDVTIQMYDEFSRRVLAVGPFSITFYGTDGTSGRNPRELDSSLSFAGLPYQTYLVTVHRDGYYDSHSSTQYSYQYKHLSATAALVPVFPSSTRIDSLDCTVNYVVPQVHLNLYASKVVPDGGFRAIVLFANVGSYVNSDFGNYVFSMPWIYQPMGSNSIELDNIYRNLRNTGFSSGMQISLTARIMSGATTITTDPQTGLSVYTNLENNTRAIVSFILP